MSGMFRVGNLADWSQLAADDSLEFEVADAPAHVSIWVLAGGKVECFVTPEGGVAQLVGSGEGNIRIRFTAESDFALSVAPVVATETPEVWVKSRREPQVIAERDIPSFTTIQPRGSGPSDGVKRMMLLMELNNRRREETLRAEIDRLGGDLAAYRSKPTPTAAPEGSPTPPAASEAPSP